MRRLHLIPVLLTVALLALGCTEFVQYAVDTLAGAQGFITQAQQNHLAECQAAPTKPFPCLTIKQAVAAQNAAITGLEAYCQLPAAPDAATLKSQGTAQCNPNPSAKQALTSELSALTTIIANYKSASPGGQP